MYHQIVITRACLVGILALATASACDVESSGSSVAAVEHDAAVMASTRTDASTRDGVESDRQVATRDVSDESFPNAPAASFPAPECRLGYTQRSQRLCISALFPERPYALASNFCRDYRGHVCTYEDLSYLYYSTTADASYNPNGRWIGNMAGNNNVYCGNRDITSNNDADIADFEGLCFKNDITHSYWCCHDRE
jgi:hypothetical protein